MQTIYLQSNNTSLKSTKDIDSDVTLSPPLHHFTHLLTSISQSELSLSSLRKYLLSETLLLKTYFSATKAQLANLQPSTLSKDRSIRTAAVEARREKWAEMEEMHRYEQEVERAWENLRQRENIEELLRQRLAECAELLVHRESLGRELLAV